MMGVNIMSENTFIYFYQDVLTITEFNDVWIGRREISELIDSFTISYHKNGYTYNLETFKDGKPIQLLKENDVVTGAWYCPSYFSSNPTYTIETRNFRMEEIICDFNSMDFKCSLCNSPIFPRPNKNCEHITFVYIEEKYGFWVYTNEKVKNLIDIKAKELNMYELGVLCEENHWDLRVFINEEESDNKLLRVFVGGKLYEI